MQTSPILSPLLAQVLVTFVAWVWMYSIRIPTMLRSGMPIQKFADDAVFDRVLARGKNTSDSLENLFEMPTLFYAAVLTIHVLGRVDGTYVALAWAFVAFRAAQALIHGTYNEINHRFAAYFVSSMCLWITWARLAWQLL